jgi:hypothetical protein
MTWTLFRQLVQYAKFEKLKKSFKDNDRVSRDIASLIECWLGCGSIVIQNSQKVCCAVTSLSFRNDVNTDVVHILARIRAEQ